MFDNLNFQKLAEAGNLTGEVVAVNSFIVEVSGLEGVNLGAQILFEDGQRGLVRETRGDKATLFNINSENIAPGTLAVVEKDFLSVPVGKKLIGRVVNPLGEPIDGKGAIKSTETSGIFNPAPGIMERSILNEQLASGVSAVDMFFPIVLGQRIAILGDSKSGKSTFLNQLTAIYLRINISLVQKPASNSGHNYNNYGRKNADQHLFRFFRRLASMTSVMPTIISMNWNIIIHKISPSNPLLSL